MLAPIGDTRTRVVWYLTASYPPPERGRYLTARKVSRIGGGATYATGFEHFHLDSGWDSDYCSWADPPDFWAYPPAAPDAAMYKLVPVLVPQTLQDESPAADTQFPEKRASTPPRAPDSPESARDVVQATLDAAHGMPAPGATATLDALHGVESPTTAPDATSTRSSASTPVLALDWRESLNVRRLAHLLLSSRSGDYGGPCWCRLATHGTSTVSRGHSHECVAIRRALREVGVLDAGYRPITSTSTGTGVSDADEDAGAS